MSLSQDHILRLTTTVMDLVRDNADNKAEIANNKTENAKNQKEIERLTTANFTLQEVIDRLQARVLELEEQLESNNSTPAPTASELDIAIRKRIKGKASLLRSCISLIVLDFLKTREDSIDWGESSSIFAGDNVTILNECLEEFKDEGSVVLLRLATKNAYHLIKSERNDAAKYGSVQEAKKKKSSDAMASQKRIDRETLFVKLKDKGDAYLKTLDTDLTCRMLRCKSIHSDEERDFDETGVKVRRKRKPAFRSTYPKINRLLGYLNKKMK